MCAFGYWIVRTGAEDYIAWLEHYWQLLPDNYQEQIQRDIHHKMDTMKQPDESGWLRVLQWKTKNATYDTVV